MKALVYHGPGAKAWEDVPDPLIQDASDAIVHVDVTTICGTDLHIMKGDTPEVATGRILGHEAVGTVREVGAGVTTVKPGDRVLVSCISACGRCQYCREEILMLSDILPTGYEVGVLNGNVRPGNTVAVVGAGPVGLAAITGARLYTPSHIIAIDLADARLEAAIAFGADLTVNNGHDDAVAFVNSVTDGRGADVAIEAVGVPDTFELCTQLVRPGGHVANIGVHGKPATLHLESLWIRDITVTMGLVDAYSTPTLMQLVTARKIDAARFVSHHFKLNEMIEAYDTFQNAADTRAVKVVMTS